MCGDGENEKINNLVWNSFLWVGGDVGDSREVKVFVFFDKILCFVFWRVFRC